MENRWIRFYGGVEMVRGAKTSMIYDLHRGSTYKIPTLLYDVFQEFKEKSVAEVKAHFEHQYDEGIDLFLEKFMDLELLFSTKEKDAFPPVSFDDWNHPSYRFIRTISCFEQSVDSN